MKNQVLEFLTETMQHITGIPRSALTARKPFDELGIDSVLILSLASALEDTFNKIPKTIFFECHNLEELTNYFIHNYPEQVQKKFLWEKVTEEISSTEELTYSFLEQINTDSLRNNGTKHLHYKQTDQASLKDIAIIGIAGRYPMAKNIEEFWGNLCEGKDCITEIPPSRWNYQKYFNPDKSKEGVIHSKWGGFIDDHDKFDPLFFRISPREAELMDPQERLFLEIAWQVFEDAGYKPGDQAIWDTAVFVGVMYGQYQLYAAEEMQKGNIIGTNVSYASIANRVSYLFNLHGESIAIDTACSSSLTAVHMACENIRSGRSKLALAGGVNLSIHPNKYVLLSDTKFLSTDGRCRSFGMGGDGYVPGEGVGAVLLKSLPQAIEDKDYIYAIIKGTATNHGGRTNGYTVPDPVAQSEVIKQALQDAAIAPHTISYIEAHGTGTNLGDPIEVRSLSMAFAGVEFQAGKCSIGSVKSNIGHCEAAAGIAALTKVLCQMKYKKLVPTLHSEPPNEDIDFHHLPFYVQKTLADWQSHNDQPLRAGISSFGAGGANAHIVVESYLPKHNLIPERKSYIFVFSAKTRNSLLSYLVNFSQWIINQKKEASLYQIAYTLATGRIHFSEARAAIVASTYEELIMLMQKINFDHQENQDGIFFSSANLVKAKSYSVKELSRYVLQQLQDEFLSLQEYKEKLFALAEIYCEGEEINWGLLYPLGSAVKQPLPYYFFEKERYWIPQIALENSSNMTNIFHPLLDENISSFNGYGFNKIFSENAFYLKDHVVAQKMILPGAVYLEMASAAYALMAHLRDPITIFDIVWLTPLIVAPTQSALVKIELYPDTRSVTSFKVISHDQSKTFAEGKIKLAPEKNIADININVLRENAARTMQQKEFYEEIKRYGINYQNSFQVVKTIWMHKDFAFAELTLDELYQNSSFGLHPALTDGILQVVFGLIHENNLLDAMPFLPYSLEQIDIYDKLPHKLLVFARLDKINAKTLTCHILVYSVEKQILLVSAKNYVVRSLSVTHVKNEMNIQIPLLEAYELAAKSEKRISSLVVLTHQREFFKKCQLLDIDKVVQVSIGNFVGEIEHNHYQIRFDHAEDFTALFSWLNSLAIDGCHWLNALNYHEHSEEETLKYGAYFQVKFTQALMAAKWPAKIKLIYLFEKSESNNFALNKMISGFFKSIRQENPSYLFKAVCIDTQENLLEKIICNEFYDVANESFVQYIQGKRLVEVLKNIEQARINKSNPVMLKPKGIYLITGGAGGLGLIFAKFLANHYKATIILVGRSELTTEKREKILEIESLGGVCLYIRADVGNHEDIRKLFVRIQDSFEHLDGILHCAGIIKPGYLLNKTLEEVKEVLAPKMFGAINLLEGVKNLRPDFVIFFSSIASLLGSFGLSDYAMANAFLDALPDHKLQRCMTINWPIWQTGGMQASGKAKALVEEFFGRGITEEEGLNFFIKALEVGLGNIAYIPSTVVNNSSEKSKETVFTKEEDINSKSNNIHVQVVDYLSQAAAKILKVPLNRLKPNVTFDQYGLDSILVLTLTKELENTFGTLPKTLFFEYQSIEELSKYFLKEHKHTLVNLFNQSKIVAEINREAPSLNSKLIQELETPIRQKYISIDNRDEIAIIGLSGIYPMGNTLQEFWNNLCAGKNCITEIPLERWDYQDFYDPDITKNNVMHSKWGGFIDHVDKFDPLFFNISPEEAALMDPQERIFLQVAWAAIEDAGYAPFSLGGSYSSEIENTRDVGVFIGVMYGHYELYASQALVNKEVIPASSLFASIANRLSFFLNLHGPSLAVDTMCSSSLTALHFACQSIRAGESQLALVGGVNITTHPHKYLLLSSGKVMSPQGKCASFSKLADGLVPGEGVGAILLKPLRQAEVDGDHIYGIIKSTVVNHGGKTNDYTVPSLNAQAGLIKKAIKQAGIDARDISYIEAHGTGTALGDPIEIRGLAKAFSYFTQNTSFCPIGSLKSNIGHTEAAAGIAGLTKVLLQFKHKKIVPSLHAEELNPNINFSHTPFFVNRELIDWQPKTNQGTFDKEKPLIAGISSFGAGGANAHVIVSNYQNDMVSEKMNKPCYLIILSAKTFDSLKEMQVQLLQWLKTYGEESNIGNISYTLCTGREHFEYRFAAVVNNLLELMDVLSLKSQLQNQYIEEAKSQVDAEEMSLIEENLIQSHVDELQYRKNLQLLADAYCAGYMPSWFKIFNGAGWRRESLPTYCFSKRRCWPESFKYSQAKEQKHFETISLTDVDGIYISSWQVAPHKPTHKKPIIQKIILIAPEHSKDIVQKLKDFYDDQECVVYWVTSNVFPLASQEYVIDCKNPATLKDLLDEITPMTTIFFIADDRETNGPSLEIVESLQLRGPLLLFQLIKVLQEAELDGDNIRLIVFTINACKVIDEENLSPYMAGLHGLTQVVAKEYPNWDVGIIDFSQEDLLHWPAETLSWLPTCLATFSEKYRTFLVIRRNKVYLRQLEKYKLPFMSFKETAFRHNGVYFLVGGAGGLGYALSQYLAQKYSATLIWIGRRTLEERIEQQIKHIRSLGGEAIYLQADVCQKNSLTAAVDVVIKKYGNIHGVVHLALTLRDGSLYRLNEYEFRENFNAKVFGSIVLCEVFANIPLDFLLFYSSIQAFVPNAGQSNYAAGSTFMDSYALFMSQKLPYPIKVLNWGYWGTVGSVASEKYRQLMSEVGLSSIEISEAMKVIEFFLISHLRQLIFIKSTETFWETLQNKPQFSNNPFSIEAKNIIAQNIIRRFQEEVINE